MSETPSKAVLRLQSSIKQLQILKGSATVGELAQSFALDIETHELALAEIASLRAQLDEARRKAIEECAAVVIAMREGFLSPEYATGQPLSSMNERIACSMILNNLIALLSESKT